MSRQDKAVTERHAKTLREMLKRPENKLCADCKRNDPRWASWNLGVFLCIRCSGVHRSMGTHISKVKSVDLDVWTPEQMTSIQKWGNRRANLYWEAHLRAGHIPPDHKMDSYIRSKYESRRWARDGPPPQDPSVLEDGAPSTPAETPPTPIAAPATPTSSRRSHTSNPSTGSVRVNAPGVTNRQPQPHQLLSASVAARNAQAPAPTAPAQASQPQQQQPVEQPAQTAANDLFTLDFHNPTPPAAQAQGQRKDVKQDILSLFSTPTASPQAAFPTAAGTGAGVFGQFTSAAVAVPQQQQNVWGQFGGAAQAPLQQPSQQTQQAQFQTTSMIGNSGPGMWGASSGWNAPAAATPAVNSLWGSSPAAGSGNQFGGFTQAQQPQAQPQAAGFFNTSDVWAAPTTMTAAAPAAGGGFGSFGGGTQKKDDVFGDLWGGFK